jgi:hypothetical protein
MSTRDDSCLILLWKGFKHGKAKVAKGFKLSLCFLGLMKRSLNMLKCFEEFD